MKPFGCSKVWGDVSEITCSQIIPTWDCVCVAEEKWRRRSCALLTGRLLSHEPVLGQAHSTGWPSLVGTWQKHGRIDFARMFSSSQRSYKQKGNTPQCSWKDLCPGPSWAVMWSHMSCGISCCRGCTVHQAGLGDSFGILCLSWKQQPVCRVPLVLWGFISTFCCLDISRHVSGVAAALHWGEGGCVITPGLGTGSTHITPDFTGAGEQTGRHLHVPSPPCKTSN